VRVEPPSGSKSKYMLYAVIEIGDKDPKICLYHRDLAVHKRYFTVYLFIIDLRRISCLLVEGSVHLSESERTLDHNVVIMLVYNYKLGFSLEVLPRHVKSMQIITSNFPQ